MTERTVAVPRFVVAPELEQWWQKSPMGAVCSFGELLGALAREGKLAVVVEGASDGALS